MALHYFSLNCQTKIQYSSIVCCLCSTTLLQPGLCGNQDSGFIYLFPPPPSSRVCEIAPMAQLRGQRPDPGLVPLRWKRPWVDCPWVWGNYKGKLGLPGKDRTFYQRSHTGGCRRLHTDTSETRQEETFTWKLCVWFSGIFDKLCSAGNPWKRSRRGSPGSPAHAEHDERRRSALHQQQNLGIPATRLAGENPVSRSRWTRLVVTVELLCILDSLCLNSTKRVFAKGPVGTRVGAQPALLSDVCETCFNRVWAPLPPTGR